MEFDSILFDRPMAGAATQADQQPACFADLRLDRVVAEVVAGREEYDLTPWLYAPTREPATVSYRHEVFQDLDDTAVYQTVSDFADRMRRTRRLGSAAEQARYSYQPQRYALEAAAVYGEAVSGLRDGLAGLPLRSRGLRAFRGWLTDYSDSSRFTSLVADAQQLLADLAKIRYTVHVDAGRVTVGPFRDEPDYRLQVEAAFDRFPYPGSDAGTTRLNRRGSWDLPRYVGMNHVDAQILERVARLYPDTFHALLTFPSRHGGFLDQTVATFDRQVQFYLAWLDYLRRFRQAGLPICYPRVSKRSEQTRIEQGYDFALAGTLLPGQPVVLNDLRLCGPERIVVVTGPNQGGKTTFARMLGQLHYLAGLGCPVPAGRAELSLPDEVFTHFEREERLDTLRGKLDDELVRVREILDRASGDSLIVMNESFSSTTLHDARFIGTRVLQRLIRLGALAVYVTFVDQLSTLDEAVISMVAAVDQVDPARQTFRIQRRPADGLAYATALAAKHGLTYEAIRKRMDR